MTTRIDTTNRGFGVYADFVDSYGAKIAVYESSAATDYCVWVAARGGSLTDNNAAMHLTREEATELRDGINAWLSEVPALEQESDGSI